VTVAENPTRWSWDTGKLAPTRGHGLYLQSVSDSMISHNELSAEGAGLYTDSCSGLVIHDNFVYNSMVGLQLQGMARCTVHDNRVEEHFRTGIVVDWNTTGCTIHDNLVHNNGIGSPTPAALERTGMVLRSGVHNIVHGNVFDNWDHNAGSSNPQQYGLVVQGVGPGSAGRPLPADNLVTGNVFRNQIVTPIVNGGDSTNKFIGNTGSQFAGGLYTDPTNQPVSAGLTGPGAAVAAVAAGLVALRNRGRRAPAP